nr:MAG TPA: hypothetical protein [Bacteriophage sp.]
MPKCCKRRLCVMILLTLTKSLQVAHFKGGGRCAKK